MSLDDVTQDKICVMEFHQKKVSRAQKNSVTFTALPFPRAQGRLYNTFYGIHWIRYRTANNSNSKTHHHMKFPHRFLSLPSIFHAMDDNDCKRVSLSVFIVRRVQCTQLRRITDAAAVSAFTTITSVQRHFEARQISSYMNTANSHILKCFVTTACNQSTEVVIPTYALHQNSELQQLELVKFVSIEGHYLPGINDDSRHDKFCDPTQAWLALTRGASERRQASESNRGERPTCGASCVG